MMHILPPWDLTHSVDINNSIIVPSNNLEANLENNLGIYPAILPNQTLGW